MWSANAPPHKRLIVSPSQPLSPWSNNLSFHKSRSVSAHSRTASESSQAPSTPTPPVMLQSTFMPPPPPVVKRANNWDPKPEVVAKQAPSPPCTAPSRSRRLSVRQSIRPATSRRASDRSTGLNRSSMFSEASQREQQTQRPYTAKTPAKTFAARQGPKMIPELSPRIVTLDGGSPRLKMFGSKVGQLKLHKRGTTSSAIMRIGGVGSDGETGSIDKSAEAFSKVVAQNVSCFGGLGALRVLRHWKRDAVHFVRELWLKSEKEQSKIPTSWVRGSSQAAVRQRTRQQSTTGLSLECFYEFLRQIGCTANPDMAQRLFRVMVYPCNMSAASIMQRPCSRVSYEQFVNGCKYTLSCRYPDKRIRCIFNFYDQARSGGIDRGQLYRSLVYVPSIQNLSENPEQRRNAVLALVCKVWTAFHELLEATTGPASEFISLKQFSCLAVQFSELTELFDLGL